MSLKQLMKVNTMMRLVLSIFLIVFIIYLFNGYTYRIAFAYYYSRTYEIIYIAWTLVACCACFFSVFLSSMKFRAVALLLILPSGIALAKLVINISTLIVFGT